MQYHWAGARSVHILSSACPESVKLHRATLRYHKGLDIPLPEIKVELALPCPADTKGGRETKTEDQSRD